MVSPSRKHRQYAESVAASDDTAAKADALQDDLREGPCLDATFESENFVVDDLRTETRWPEWAARVADLGLRSSMSVRLTSNNESIGALNLYGDQPGAFAGDLDIAMIYATYAAEAMSRARLVSGLRNAMGSRHTIGMAQGVLAVRYDISYERAFQVLHRYSNDHNIKLRTLAEQVMEAAVPARGHVGRTRASARQLTRPGRDCYSVLPTNDVQQPAYVGMDGWAEPLRWDGRAWTTTSRWRRSSPS